MNEELKTCSKCNQEKEIKKFHKDGAGGFRSVCKICRIEALKKEGKYLPKYKSRYLGNSFFSDELIDLICKYLLMEVEINEKLKKECKSLNLTNIAEKIGKPDGCFAYLKKDGVRISRKLLVKILEYWSKQQNEK